MYTVFFGTDRKGVRDAATQYLKENLPTDATLTTIEAVEYQTGQLADALGATSLFGGSEWFILDTPSANEDMLAEVTHSLPELSESGNTFLILEGLLLAPAKKKYATHAVELCEQTAPKAERTNPFVLAEALASKDKRRLWLLLQEAKLSGAREEELVGLLWWQLKTLRLASLTDTATEAGMKDFPYNKAKRALAKFAPGEVERLAQSLLELYHDGHAGVRDLEIALEEWVLKT